MNFQIKFMYLSTSFYKNNIEIFIIKKKLEIQKQCKNYISFLILIFIKNNLNIRYQVKILSI